MSYLNDKPLEAYTAMGCHPVPDGWRFRVWAPNARAVSLVGDFNGWITGNCPMERDEFGIWTVVCPRAGAGMVYKYAVTGPDGETVLKADPFAFHAETGPATASRVWDIEGFSWSDGDWMAARAAEDIRFRPVNIYEVHLGSWWREPLERYPNYRNIAPKLADYCHQQGYTHVELLPLTEYPYEGSWGYQVTGYFAPTSRYGTPQDLMAFVDILHAAGIGVILDWVPAHFPRDSHGLARFDGTPLFEYADPRMGEHPQWGTLVFDYASPDVRAFLMSSALFFLEKYHVDGLRCDAVSSMLYLDYGREPGQFVPNRDGGDINYDAVSFWQELTTAVRERCPGAFLAAEESTAYPGVTAPPEEGGLGFTFKWDMGFMNDTLGYFRMDPIYRSHHHRWLTFSMMYAFSERFVLPFSHDEVVHGKGSMLRKMGGTNKDRVANLRAMYGYIYAHPGKKLLFMGGEFGQLSEWNEKRVLEWPLLQYPKHSQLQAWTAALGKFYQAEPAFWEIEDSWDGFLWLNPDDNYRSSIAFLRRDRTGKGGVVCLCNFTPVSYEDFYVGLPGPGRLVPLLSSDELRFGGTGEALGVLESEPTEFREFHHMVRAALPPLSATYYRYEEEPVPCTQ